MKNSKKALERERNNKTFKTIAEKIQQIKKEKDRR
jgi:hypothetical protein